jgi:hypothetical protein
VAESVIIVCDVCGSPAEDGVTIRVGGRNLAKDLCAKHLRELLAGTHTPKRGRRLGSTSASTSRRTSGKRAGAKRTAKIRRASANGRRKSRRTRATAAKVS